MRQILGNNQIIGPTAFTPEDAGPTLTAWFDASDSSTITLGVGSQIASWANKAAGAPASLLALTPNSAGPETSTNNGAASIKIAMDGGRDMRSSGNVAWEDIAGLNVGAMVLVASFTGYDANVEVVGWKSGPDNQVGMSVSGLTDSFTMRWAGNTGTTTNAIAGTSPVSATNAFMLGKGDGGGSDAVQAYNLQWSAWDSDNDDVSGDSGLFRIGQIFGSDAGAHMHVHEFLLYDDELSQAQWTALYNNYLKAKWGVP